MFALFVIQQYALSTLAVGYITLSLAATIVFSSVIIFDFLSKRIGMYVETVIACGIFALSALMVPFVMEEMWVVLFVVVFGFGISFGPIRSAMSSMSAEYTNVNNRGFILSLVNMSNNAALIVGPLFMGVLYGLDITLPFYACAASNFTAGMVMTAMLIKWPRLRRPTKTKTDEVTEDDDDANWVYTPDKVTKRDYMRLGKGFGTMLTKRHYHWVTYHEELFGLLDTMFPEIAIDTLGRHREGIKFIKDNAKQMREQYDALHLLDIQSAM